MLFQVHFLSLLLEERGAGDLAAGRRALPRQARPPPPARLRRGRGRRTPARCCATGTRSSATRTGREPGIFGEVPENLPGPLYARKVQRRAASTGFDFPGVEGPLEAVRDEAGRARGAPRAATSASTRSATCSSPPSTWPASCGSIRSSRCAPRPSASAAGSRRRRRWPQRDGRSWDDLDAERAAELLRSRPPQRDPRRPTMSQIERVHARQILDSRGNPTVEVERRAALRRARPRRRALRRLDRRVRGDRAARRRRRVAAARASRRAVGNVNGEIAEAVARPRRARPGGARPGADRARRHAEQVAPRRQRDPRRLAGRRARGRGRGAACRCGATSAARRRTSCRCR